MAGKGIGSEENPDHELWEWLEKELKDIFKAMQRENALSTLKLALGLCAIAIILTLALTQWL